MRLKADPEAREKLAMAQSSVFIFVRGNFVEVVDGTRGNSPPRLKMSGISQAISFLKGALVVHEHPYCC